MKKHLFLSLLLSVALFGLAQPKVTDVTYQPNAGVFGLFEVSFYLNTYDNPYDPEVIDVFAEFIGPDNTTYKVIGFYYEGYRFEKQEGTEIAIPEPECRWKIRFTPDAVGEWHFTLHAKDAKGETVMPQNGGDYVFQCTPENSAKGFITKANKQYLKRTVVTNGQKHHTSFFPVGPNVAWYSCTDIKTFQQPYGIYYYEHYIDSLAGNCNYMRIWINRYQYLSLYGPEHTALNGERFVMFFDSTLNQKDAAELDYIINYAAANDIAIMFSIFNAKDFFHTAGVSEKKNSNPKAMLSDWNNNPFHTVLGLESPFLFFSDPEAVRITKNLLRYIVARWGYATNIMNWELWNEIANISQNVTIEEQFQNDIVDWHSEMASYLRSIDPFHHLISTSPGSVKVQAIIGTKLFDNLDFSQKHNYQNFQNAKPKERFFWALLKLTQKYKELYPDLPFFAGEFGFSLSNSKHRYENSDPKFVELHCSLWSSLFSGSMGPASFWYWEALESLGMFHRFRPVNTFCDKLPILSDSFTAATTASTNSKVPVFPNGLATFYLVNAAEDSLFGWSQDTSFCYQSLRRRTDRVGSDKLFADDGTFDPEGYVYTLNPAKRPNPSSRSNTITIPIENQAVGTRYRVRWFDAETGREIESASTSVFVRRSWIFWKRLTFEFPSEVRDVQGSTVSNTFGDAVFMVYKVSK